MGMERTCILELRLESTNYQDILPYQKPHDGVVMGKNRPWRKLLTYCTSWAILFHQPYGILYYSNIKPDIYGQKQTTTKSANSLHFVGNTFSTTMQYFVL